MARSATAVRSGSGPLGAGAAGNEVGRACSGCAAVDGDVRAIRPETTRPPANPAATSTPATQYRA